MLIPTGFRFHDASDPNQSVSKKEEVSPLDQRLKALQEKDNELFSAAFGKGVVKGKKEVTDAHLQEVVDKRYEKAHQALAEERIHRVLLEKAKEQGFQHPEDVADLLQTALTLNDDLDIVYAGSGEKISVDDAVANIARVKPYWVKSKQLPGTGSVAPPKDCGKSNSEKPKFKRSQLRDSAFYLANEAAILEAARDHRIIDDV